MLPANPQTQSLAQTPNRAAGSAVSAGSGAAASASAPRTGTQATPAPTKQTTPTSTPGIVGGTGYQRQCTVGGVIIACVPSNPALGSPGGGGGGGGGGCNPSGFIATQMNPLDRVGPNPCGGGGGGGFTPCYTNGQGGTPCVAMRQPTKGAVCDGSPTEIGDQYPGNTTTYADEIVNIFPVFANNQTGNEDVVAWEYTMGAGNMYIQGNQAFQGFWQNLAAGAFGPAAAFESGGISGMNSDQASQVNSYAASHHGYVGTTACFSNNLPPAQT